MSPRTCSLWLALLCLAAAGPALAKKSHVTVKNCTGSKVNVKIFNGDQLNWKNPEARADKDLAAGRTEKWSCKVGSGKKRCGVSLGNNKTIRVNNGRTLYVNRHAKRVEWTNFTGCTDRTKVALKVSGHYVTVAANKRTQVSRTRAGAFGTWWMQETEPRSGKFVFQNAKTGLFFSSSARGDRTVMVDKDAPKSAETFVRVSTGDGQYAFKAPFGKYLRFEEGRLRATASGYAQASTRFTLEPVN